MAGEIEYPLRDAVFEDCEEINALLAGLGLVVPIGRDAIISHWDQLWRSNPAIDAHGGRPNLGWVMEDEGRIVGFFGNIPLLYYFARRPVVTSSARAWAVQKPYRTQTRRLAEAFFNQENVDLLLITTANAPSGKICLRHGGSKLPQYGYGQVLYWVIDSPGFITSGLRKKGLNVPLAALGGIAGAPLLAGHLSLSRRYPKRQALAKRPALDVERISVADIGADFDDLWQRKIAEGDRLLACRDARTLRWYFGPSSATGGTAVLTLRRGGRLEGYAVICRDDTPSIGLKRARIADLVAAGDDGEVADALLGAAFEHGRDEKCHILEVVGLPRCIRERVEACRPLSRPMPTFPFYFKALDASLAPALDREEGWYVTPYDGDTSLL